MKDLHGATQQRKQRALYSFYLFFCVQTQEYILVGDDVERII